VKGLGASEALRRSRRAAAAAVVVVVGLAWPLAAVAAEPDRAGKYQRAPARRGEERGPQGNAANAAATTSDPGGSRPVGTVNPLAIENPFCEQDLARAQRRNCRVTGTPEGRYPVSNYGLDIHVDTGLDNIIGNFQALLAQIANAIWQAALFVLSLIITLLGWAFGLSPFTDSTAVAEIDRGLEQFYRAFTAPWLVVGMVALGAWLLWRAVARRQVSSAIGAAALTLVSMLAALWVVHEPRQSIGTAAKFTNAAAMTVLAAPQRGSLSSPVASYGETTTAVWNAMTIPGFAALNFSNVDWALSAPDAELLETSNRYACLDSAYLAQIPPRRWERLLGSAAEDGADCAELGEIAPAPRTNAEIYLRSSPGSAAREVLWEEHTDDAPYASYLAIQGSGGAWTRLPLVVLVVLGLLGGICLLAWLALRIFVQAAVAFVLVLAAPLALFFPAFGEVGRRAFVLWGGTLLGALVSKLVYAALLSVSLFATTVIGSLADDAGAMMAFLVMAGLWWAVFLKRESLVSFLSVSSDGEGGDGRIGRVLGLYAAARVGSRMLTPLQSAVTRGAGAAKASLVGDRGDHAQATRRIAQRDLSAPAARRLDQRLDASRAVAAEQAARRRRLATVSAARERAETEVARLREAGSREDAPEQRGRHLVAARKAQRKARGLRAEEKRLASAVDGDVPRARAARSMITGAEEREQRGARRWSAAEIAASREAIRGEVDRPASDPVHAWRVGMEPQRYHQLSGAEREAAHAEVAEQVRADRLAFGAIPDRPEGIVERRARHRYRSEVRRRESGRAELRGERRTVTRRRRGRSYSNRRGVSR